MFNIGTQELLIILFVVLLLFGARRIPEVARALGKGVGDFRDALAGVEKEIKGEGGISPVGSGASLPPSPGRTPSGAGAESPGDRPARPARPGDAPEPSRSPAPDRGPERDDSPEADPSLRARRGREPETLGPGNGLAG